MRELEKADLQEGRDFWKRLVDAEVVPVALAGFLWAIIEVSLKKERFVKSLFLQVVNI